MLQVVSEGHWFAFLIEILSVISVYVYFVEDATLVRIIKEVGPLRIYSHSKTAIEFIDIIAS